MPEELRDPWLVAAWPGMGNVALAAGGYLVETLEASITHVIPPGHFFELKHVEVKDGIAEAGRLPRSMFFEWRDPAGRRDLLIFVAEAQPPIGGLSFCQTLLDYAMQRGVRRFFTFAAMATQLHPSNTPRVFAAANGEPALADLRPLEVEVLREGQISGLNGVLLAAGAERSLPGACLLGELPFFAVGVPNPRAAQAVLEIFTRVSGIDVDLTRITDQARMVESSLLELLERMKEAARRQREGEQEFDLPDLEAVQEVEEQATEPGETKPDPPALDPRIERRIEALFTEAKEDRAQAGRLKEMLDRYAVFDRYEDRFLDLFKHGD